MPITISGDTSKQVVINGDTTKSTSMGVGTSSSGGVGDHNFRQVRIIASF